MWCVVSAGSVVRVLRTCRTLSVLQLELRNYGGWGVSETSRLSARLLAFV